MSFFKHIHVVFIKVRTFGLPGVLLFLKRMMFEKRKSDRTKLLRAMARDAKCHSVRPQNGITVVADFSSTYALCKTMRDFVVQLKRTGIPVQTFNTSVVSCNAKDDFDWAITPDKEFDIGKYDHIVGMMSGWLPKLPGVKTGRVAFWEFESGFDFCSPDFDYGDFVIGMSDFNVSYFRKIAPKGVSVHKVLYPFLFPKVVLPLRDDVRKKYGWGADEFIVFYNFSASSGWCRKNPLAAVRAFASAFLEEKGVRLVFKVSDFKADDSRVVEMMRLVESLGLKNRFDIVDEYLPQDDLYGLVNATDVYLSLHRGEGFGLGIAEAMALGKPVVVTNYSATTEFCNEKTAMLVPYRMVSPERDALDVAFFSGVKEWPEPDVRVAASCLKKLHDDVRLRGQIGGAGRSFVMHHFAETLQKSSIETFVKT